MMITYTSASNPATASKNDVSHVDDLIEVNTESVRQAQASINPVLLHELD